MSYSCSSRRSGCSPGEYQGKPTWIAVYDTSAGIGAEPVRWDVYVLDPQTGEITAFEVKVFEDTSVIISSTEVNPARKDEVYSVYTTLSKMDR